MAYTKKRCLKVGILTALILASYHSHSSGFMFGAHSISTISTAMTSGMEDNEPSTFAQNPATISFLPGTQISQSFVFVPPRLAYDNAKAWYFNTHEPVQGASKGKFQANEWAPSLFVSHQLNEKLTLGLGIFASGAAEANIPKDSVMRYNVNRLKILSINLNPALSFKINDHHALAAGVSAVYTKVWLRQFADFNPGINQALPVIGRFGWNVVPRKTDGYASMSGKDISFAYNLGWVWDINDDLRFGIAYRSKTKPILKGTGEWKLTGEAYDWPILGKRFEEGVRENGYVAKEGGVGKVTFPAYFTFNLRWKTTPKLNLFANAQYTLQSQVNEITIEWEHPKHVPNSITTKANGSSNMTYIKPVWKNSWKYGLGATYQITDKLQLRGGIAVDLSPITHTDHRLPTLPDNKRFTWGVGAKYAFDPTTDIIFGVMVEKGNPSTSTSKDWCGPSIETGPGSVTCVASRQSINAEFTKLKAKLVGIQINKRF